MKIKKAKSNKNKKASRSSKKELRHKEKRDALLEKFPSHTTPGYPHHEPSLGSQAVMRQLQKEEQLALSGYSATIAKKANLANLPTNRADQLAYVRSLKSSPIP